MRGDGGVAGEGNVGESMFHFWGKCTMPIININSDRISYTSSGLCVILVYLYYVGPLFHILGCNKQYSTVEHNFLQVDNSQARRRLYTATNIGCGGRRSCLAACHFVVGFLLMEHQRYSIPKATLVFERYLNIEPVSLFESEGAKKVFDHLIQFCSLSQMLLHRMYK